MPITLDLVEDGRLLLWAFIDPWTLDEINMAFAEAYDYFEASHAPIHTLSNWTRSQTIPLGLMSVRHSSPFFWHPRSGYVLVIDAPDADKILLHRLRDEKIPGVERFIYFDTEAEARADLRQILAAEAQKAVP